MGRGAQYRTEGYEGVVTIFKLYGLNTTMDAPKLTATVTICRESSTQTHRSIMMTGRRKLVLWK